MKKILGVLCILTLFACAFTFGATPGSREYYYFFSVEAPNDLEVIKINDAGQLLEGPTVLRNSGDVSGVCVSKTSSDKYVVYTLFNSTGRITRYDFTPPGTLSNGTLLFTRSFNFNVDCTQILGGALVGSNEGNTKGNATAHRLDESGFSLGKFYNVIPRIDQTQFASVRADGKEAIIVSFCCKSPEIAIQPLGLDFHALGTPIVTSHVKNFGIDAVRMSANGRFAIASSDGDGLRLYTLDPTTRKGGTPVSLPLPDQLVHFDSTVINEDGTFILFNEFVDGGTLFFQQLDGAGHFVGSPAEVFSAGDHFNYGNLIPAN